MRVTELDTNLFRGVRLWRPTMARGVFGGQVVSMALVSGVRRGPRGEGACDLAVGSIPVAGLSLHLRVGVYFYEALVHA